MLIKPANDRIQRGAIYLTLFLFLSLWTSGAALSSPEELVFLTWAEYMDPGLITVFESKFDARIKPIYYETDELKNEMLIETNSVGYDVVLTSGIAALSYLKKKWLHPIEISRIPNLQHIDSKWLNAHPKLNGFAAPFLWGSLGIAFRKDLVAEPIESWKQLFNPSEHLRNKIIMIKDSVDTIGPALKSLGYSFNSENHRHYDEVEPILLAQKPYVQAYSYIAINEKSSLVTGKAWVATVYNGDALMLQAHHPQITFVVPTEGTGLWIDYLVVMEASERKELAENFINFLNEPQNAARLSSYLMFATPNKAAEKFLAPEFLKNPVIYPGKPVLDRSEFARQLPPRIVKRRNTIFTKVAY